MGWSLSLFVLFVSKFHCRAYFVKRSGDIGKYFWDLIFVCFFLLKKNVKWWSVVY